MISFDDYGGAGGSSVDLSPIYFSLGVLKNNTQSIWDYVSTMTNLYLETYRTENEDYMYNITGGLPTINNTDGNKFIRGYMSTVQDVSLYAVNMDIDYIGLMSNCSFDGRVWSDALSLRGSSFVYNDFQKNNRVSVSADVLAHNYFVSIGSASINAINLHTLENGSGNSFLRITHLDLTCNTIQTPYIQATEMNLKCKEMYGGEIFGGMYHNIDLVSLASQTINLIEQVNLTGKTIYDCTLSKLDYLNFQCYMYASNLIQSVSDFNFTGRLVSDMTLKSITYLDLNAQSISSLYLSNNDIVKLNFYDADSIVIYPPSATCDISMTGRSLIAMTLPNSNVQLNGSVKTLDRIYLSEGTVNLTCDVLNLCSLDTVKGIISAKTVNLCNFSRCHDLTVYADSFAGDVKRCWNVNFYCNTLQKGSFDSMTSLFLSFKSLTVDKPYINAAYMMTLYCDLEGFTAYPSSNKPIKLLQGQNWLGKLYLKSEIQAARGDPAQFSQAGISMTQTFGYSDCPLIVDYKSAIA